MFFTYGCGFNAFHQISNSVAASDDVPTLVEVLQGTDEQKVKVMFAGWSSTVLLQDDQIVVLGQLPNARCGAGRLEIKLPHAKIESDSEIRSVFGDLNGPLGLITWNGQFYAIETKLQGELTLDRRGNEDSPKLSHVAIMATGRTATVMLQAKGSEMAHILDFDSFPAFERWFADPSRAELSEKSAKPFQHHMLRGRAISLLAGATCFVMLMEGGKVFSWGDGRHARCLGRMPDTESPANKPSLVGALGGLPIAKISGCGWMFGALSTENDLYLWGRDKPGTKAELGALFGDPDEDVRLVDDERFDEVSDFAVGNGHAILATAQGEIYTVGENRNGQIGTDGTSRTTTTTWNKIARFDPGQDIALAAGDAATFVLSTRAIQKA